MNNRQHTRNDDFAQMREGAKDFGKGFGLLALRAIALPVYIVLSLAEPFIGIILSFLAFGCFAVAVLFGFIFQVHFPHRWEVLGAAVVFMLIYFAYLSIVALLARLLR